MKTDNTTMKKAAAPTPVWLDKPFALFAGATYYPSPGWQGHMGQYGDVEAAAERGKRAADEMYGWWQIVDLRTLEIVAGEGSGHTGLWGPCEACPDEEEEAITSSQASPPPR